MSERKVINLADLEMKVSRRGRKSTVTSEDIADAKALEINDGWEIEEAHVDHADFADYLADAIRRDSTKTEADVMNAWQSRFRQRAIALAKASGVEIGAVFTNDGGCYFIRKS